MRQLEASLTKDEGLTACYYPFIRHILMAATNPSWFIVPLIAALTAPLHAQNISREKEAEIMRDVKVPDSFETTVFAAPPAVNYPVFVAAAPDGTLFVSSDKNGSLGREPNR